MLIDQKFTKIISITIDENVNVISITKLVVKKKRKKRLTGLCHDKKQTEFRKLSISLRNIMPPTTLLLIGSCNDCNAKGHQLKYLCLTN